jgi:hypothetical protein
MFTLTPPMGFNNWNAFGCDVDEDLIKETTDRFISLGLKGLGYEYVNIDDCWSLPEQGRDGRLVLGRRLPHVRQLPQPARRLAQDFVRRYTAMKEALDATGRPIVYAICDRAPRTARRCTSSRAARRHKRIGEVRCFVDRASG